jgi:hypothetical protein
MFWNGNECVENQGNENLKATIPSADYNRLKAAGELGSMITNDGRNTREIIYRIPIVKAAFNKTKTFHKQFNEETSVNSYIRKIAPYGVETWTLRKVDQKYLKSFDTWCWKKMEKIS